jgi:ATP-binding cassette subfamily F protein 3
MTRRNRYNTQISSKINRFKLEKRPKNKILINYLLRFNFQDIFKSGKNIADGEEITKNFNSNIIFQDTNFEILSGQKIGLIGPNGCGKTTFLKLLTGEEKIDNGTINISKGVKLGYFDQGNLSLNPKNTLIEEVLKNHSELNENDSKALLGQFNFIGKSVLYKQVEKLSGGEQTKLALLKLLIKPYNFIILDEPTNHMDIESKKTIENAITTYNGTLLLVSHDRRFLDNVTDTIFVIKNHKIETYKGNYSMYRYQLFGGMNKISETELIEISGKYLKKYLVMRSFTDWSQNKKYKIGDEVLIDENNYKAFEWAINTGKLKQKTKKRKKL